MTDKVMKGIYDKISETGVVTDNQLAIIIMNAKMNKPSTLNVVIKTADEFFKIVDKIFPKN